MSAWILRIACLLAAAALIAGCGGASQSASSSPAAASSAPAKHARSHKARTQQGKSRSSRFPAKTEAAFRQSCATYERHAIKNVPLQYHAMVPLAITEFCTCALGKVEAAVSLQRFKHDLLAAVYGQGLPRYVAVAEQACSGQLQGLLALIPAA